jgi:nucleotide-binding universal stress UspA family protein
VYDYDEAQPDILNLPLEEVSRYRDTQMQRIDAQMETKMKAFLADVPTDEPPITPLLKVGNPRQVIVATAEALGVDCLVIGAHSKRSFLDVLLGGTATAVSRHAACAVMMVQPGERPPLVQTSEVEKPLQATLPGQPA